MIYKHYKCERCGDEWLIPPLIHTFDECDAYIKKEKMKKVREILCISIATVPVHRYRG